MRVVLIVAGRLDKLRIAAARLPLRNDPTKSQLLRSRPYLVVGWSDAVAHVQPPKNLAREFPSPRLKAYSLALPSAYFSTVEKTHQPLTKTSSLRRLRLSLAEIISRELDNFYKCRDVLVVPTGTA